MTRCKRGHFRRLGAQCRACHRRQDRRYAVSAKGRARRRRADRTYRLSGARIASQADYELRRLETA